MGIFDKFDLGDTLSAIAPLAGKMIGGPYAALAVSAVQAVFGDDEPDPKQLAKKIKNATPEQLIALRKIDVDLELKMREMEITEDELHFKNTANARALFSINDKPQIWFAVTFVAGYFIVLFVILYAAFFSKQPISADREIIATLFLLVGQLTSEVKQISNFWFGTSKSSQDKNQIISNVQALNGKGTHQ